MTANQPTAKDRARTLRAWLAANPDATETEKCETTRKLGFHTQNSLNAEIATVIAKRSGRA